MQAAPAKTITEPELQLNDQSSSIAALDSQLDVLAPQTHSEMPSRSSTPSSQDLLQLTLAPPAEPPFTDLGIWAASAISTWIYPPLQPTTCPNPVARPTTAHPNTLDGSVLLTGCRLWAAPPELNHCRCNRHAHCPSRGRLGLRATGFGRRFSGISASARSWRRGRGQPSHQRRCPGYQAGSGTGIAAIGDSEGARSLIEDPGTKPVARSKYVPKNLERTRLMPMSQRCLHRYRGIPQERPCASP